MAIQRANPLPVGLYWIDIIGAPKTLQFRSWLARNSDSVTVEKDEYHLPTGDYPEHTWYRFAVGAPVAWEGPGFPDIIPDGESPPQTEKETSQSPHVASTGEVIDQLEESVKDAADSAKTGFYALLAAGGMYIIYKLIS